MAIDDKRIYVPLTNIYGKKAADGTYSLSALDLKSLNDNLYNIVKKLQGGITCSDLTSLTVDELQAGTVISNTVITNNLYSVFGDVAELTVDRLVTADKVTRYQSSDTSDINYVWIQDQHIKFMTGTTGGSTTQHTDRNGDLLYWCDADMLSMSTTATAYPVTIYDYAETCKMELRFDLDAETGYYIPKLVLGAGDGVLENSAKAYIYKGTTGLELDYYKSNTGDLRQIKLSDDGVFITPYDLESIDFYDNGFSAVYGGQTIAFTWTTDANGVITELTTEDLDTIPVTWHEGDM